ncbi:MAG: class I SAM-dependent methyltransferase [Bacteroidota bacterium]|nr:class I SAM-dependent methyltransferase [Bacteroidota bacterium]MXW14039.1 methyltransferase domain-containing protein [Rhodothermaceae bacterium]MDE2645963.1 class I SAM-dependent methyltransferase [Bacteroidota bacterium]MXW32650.1 methyltransferase domain-containing protein [Rhodothermaceae bacterium]MYC03627.1 methyltransferase domain-containing protein [Rhodothermaceae bacterium]
MESDIAKRAASYESIDPGQANAWLEPYIPREPASILDVGAGSGRDAAWLASKGHQVIAVEPSHGMRREAERHHSRSAFTLVADQLPDIKETSRSGMSFDLILLNAVWMFIPPAERERSFRKLIALLKPRGVIAISFRTPCESHRGMSPVSVPEIEQLALSHGAYVESTEKSSDFLGRPDVEWHQMIIRLPDDGTGALPLIRRIVLLDDKSSTYKLALLRSLCRVASISPGLAHESGSDQVTIPLGAVALAWIQLYLPLLKANMPQNPRNESGGQYIGFANNALDTLIASPQETVQLRPGASLYEDRAKDLTSSLRDAAATIERMPVRYLYYPDGQPIFTVTKKRFRVGRSIKLNEDYFSEFGEMIVPAHLWRALQRYSVWIEPALVEEWIRLMRGYADRQDRPLDELKLRRLMRPYEPERNQGEVRNRALKLLHKQSVYCVWTGKKLHAKNMHIDHCLPWAAWPCDDLWNLMPANKASNLSKRNHLPDNITIREAQDRIMTWWDDAYRREEATRERFLLEAKARLPALTESAPSLDDVFFALDLQRTRLYNDHRIPEWSGPRGSVPTLLSTRE